MESRASSSINSRELLEVLFAFQTFSDHVKGRSVQVMCDNVTAVAYVNHLGGPGQLLSKLAEAIWAVAWNLDLQLHARHLAGVINVRADHLSRLPLHYEWKLHLQLFGLIDETWGPHSIDRFACMATTQLPRFKSRFLDPLSEGVAGLSQQNWAQENNYVNPPFRLRGKVLDLIIAQQATATLIAPRWPNRPWYQKLERLSIDQPIRIPTKQWAMIKMGKVAEPLRNKHWKLYAWRICGRRVSAAKAGPRQLLQGTYFTGPKPRWTFTTVC